MEQFSSFKLLSTDKQPIPLLDANRQDLDEAMMLALDHIEVIERFRCVDWRTLGRPWC
jgi:hypothetical protein